MIVKRLTLLAATSLTGLVLTGCGAGGPVAHPAAPTTHPVAATGAATSATSSRAPGTHPRHPSTFETPDHNITCRATPATRGVECAVSTKRWHVPGGDRHWCGPTALEGLGMANGDEPSFLCATDVLVPDPDEVLAYGQVFRDGPISCWSRRWGVTCSDGGDNHFMVSPWTYRTD
ncbi:hypothetical protein [Nocardioides montaniterrae]